MKKYFFLCALMMTMSLSAQKAKKSLKAPIPQTESAFQLAAQLSKYGYANKSAISLINAAQIIKENGITEGGTMHKTNKDKASTTGAKKGTVTLDADKLLSDAKDLAGSDATLLAMIENVKNAQKRGAVDGRIYHSDAVNANSTDTYSIHFKAEELAVVSVIGDGDTDLDLYVYDSNGNLIDSDTDYTDNCVATFTPRWTGKFTVKIMNRGGVYNRYVLRTN